jgi:hypothetical protein
MVERQLPKLHTRVRFPSPACQSNVERRRGNFGVPSNCAVGRNPREYVFIQSRVLGVLKIDVTKQIIERLTGVVTGVETDGEQTPQTKIGSEAHCRSTLRTRNRPLLQMHPNRNAVHQNADVNSQN